MKLTQKDLKKKFLEIIEKKITFLDASNWASEMLNLDNIEQLEYDDEHMSKIFSGLTFLSGVDLEQSPGLYLHSISDVEREFKNLFINELSTYETIENFFVKDWNPLELNNELEIFEQYQSYYGKVYNLLFWHKSKEEISDYLFKIQTEDLGQKSDKKNTDKLAQQLLDLTHDYFH
jgi:hypothetical protein